MIGWINIMKIGKYEGNKISNKIIRTSRLDHNDNIFRTYFVPFLSAKGFDKIVPRIQ
jgi:hypothetical protein